MISRYKSWVFIDNGVRNPTLLNQMILPLESYIPWKHNYYCAKKKTQVLQGFSWTSLQFHLLALLSFKIKSSLITCTGNYISRYLCSKIPRYFVFRYLVTQYHRVLVNPKYSEIGHFKSRPSPIRFQDTQYPSILHRYLGNGLVCQMWHKCTLDNSKDINIFYFWLYLLLILYLWAPARAPSEF